MQNNHHASLTFDFSLQGRVHDDQLFHSSIPAMPLAYWVHSFWQLTVPAGGYTYRAIPDNHVDIIFDINQQEAASVVAPFCSPTLFEMAQPATYFGIRLRVLAQRALTKAPIVQWQGANGIDLFGLALMTALAESLASSASFANRCQQASAILLQYLQPFTPDPRLLHFMHYALSHNTSAFDLSDKHCNTFGLSARQLRRLSQTHLGLSPRDFCRVVRFQRAVHQLYQGGQTPWTEYFDQAHCVREFKSLAGVTPRELLTMSVLYNTDHLKT